MFEPMVAELGELLDGTLEFSSESVNYGLESRRMNARIDVRVLPSHEVDWSRVMVSVQDETEPVRAHPLIQENERYSGSFFSLSPVSLWVEDFSGVKRLMDEARLGAQSEFSSFPQCSPRVCGALHGENQGV